MSFNGLRDVLLSTEELRVSDNAITLLGDTDKTRPSEIVIRLVVDDLMSGQVVQTREHPLRSSWIK